MQRPLRTKLTITLLRIFSVALVTSIGCSRSSGSKPRQGASVGTTAPEAGPPNLPVPSSQPTASIFKTVIEPHAVSPLQLKDDDQDKFARAHVNFTLNLLRRLEEGRTGENFVVSPIALQLALGLAVVGARGGGENRLARATAPGVKPDRIYEVMQSWQEQLLRSMNSASQPGTQSVGALGFGNSLWLDESLQPTSGFVDKAREFYGFGVFRAPLRRSGGNALSAINQWLSERSEGRIVQMVKALSPTEQAVLAASTYLKTKFSSPFGSVEPEPFASPANPKGSADMMRNVLRARYVQNTSYQALELDLVYGATSLVSIMPLIGNNHGFLRGLNGQKWNQLLSSLEHSKSTLDLYWPKLNLRNRYDKLFESLNLPGPPLAQPFVAPNCELTSFVHEAELVISQDGIEVPSAAGTAAQSPAPIEDKNSNVRVVRFDHPFLFAVVHRLTGSILFTGQVVAP